MGFSNFSGPVVSRAGFISGADSIVPATAATLTVTPEAHSGRTVVLSRAAGQAITLPAATGSGNAYRFFVATTITSNTTTIKVVGNDTMAGTAIVANDGGDTASIFETAATSDTITFDGSTTGGILGATVELQDVAADLWAVRIVGAATGTEATPFSATVS
jgi:hypothetical protein